MLSKLTILNRRDISWSAAIFMLLYTHYPSDNALQLSIEFLSAILIHRDNSDG